MKNNNRMLKYLHFRKWMVSLGLKDDLNGLGLAPCLVTITSAHSEAL
jgi:hypothetical protein